MNDETNEVRKIKKQLLRNVIFIEINLVSIEVNGEHESYKSTCSIYRHFSSPSIISAGMIPSKSYSSLNVKNSFGTTSNYFNLHHKREKETKYEDRKTNKMQQLDVYY